MRFAQTHHGHQGRDARSARHQLDGAVCRRAVGCPYEVAADGSGDLDLLAHLEKTHQERGNLPVVEFLHAHLDGVAPPTSDKD